MYKQITYTAQQINFSQEEMIATIISAPWGTRRNSNWTTANVPTSFIFDRGFTSHEHLDEFGLINMNGRVYDDAVGRFLSPDPFVQMPDNAQNFNRYSYCLNNPLKYKDPSGNIAILFDGLIRGFIKGLIFGRNPWESTVNHVNNSVNIWRGLFEGDATQIVSRFTKELPQTYLGFLTAHGANTFLNVEWVKHYDGATIVKHRGSYMDGRGMTLGSFIQGDRTIEPDPNNALFQHEYGHYIQSRAFGWAYMSRVALPSLFSKYPHHANPVEQDANVRALKHFDKFTEGAFEWQFEQNPIGRDGTAWNMNDLNDPAFNELLDDLLISPESYDYTSWLRGGPLGVIGVGIINTYYYNTHYVDFWYELINQ